MAITKNIWAWDAETKKHVKTGEEVTHAGRVIAVFHDDYRAMSDVYCLATFATVVREDGAPERVLVNANFECDLSEGRAEVDASPEAVAQFQAWEAEQRRLHEARKEASRIAAELERRNRPEVGKKMQATKGQHKGLVGTVAYVSGSSALIKPDDVWQDRKADGTWVRASSLAAR